MAPFRFLATMGAPCGTCVKSGVRSYPSSAFSTCTQIGASVHVQAEDETGALLAELRQPILAEQKASAVLLQRQRLSGLEVDGPACPTVTETR